MPLPTTEAQESNLTARVGRPVYIVRHAHSGVDEFVSCSGHMIYDGQIYEEGGCNMRSIEDSRTASFNLPATIARKQEVQNGTWRDGDCTIYHIPGAPDDGGTYNLEDGFIILEGKIQTSAFKNGVISVTATHTNNLNKISPRHTWDEVCPHIPAAGTELSWEGDRLILSARTFKGRGSAGANPSLAARGRLSAKQLKSLSQPAENLTLTATGAGAPIPIIYGERPVPGSIIAVGSISGDLVLAVGWGYGEVQSVEDVYINGEAVPGGVTVTHYLGGTGQGVDPTLASAIPAFNSDMILRTPEGDIGCFYSVFRIPSGQLSAAPTFMMVPKGKAVFDPRVLDDAYAPLTQLEVVFDGPDGSTAATDDSPSEHSISLSGGAEIQGGVLLLDGAGTVTIVNQGELNPTDQNFTIEIKAKPEALTGTVDLYNKYTVSGDQRSILIRRRDDEIVLWLSSAGTSWDIAAGRVVATLTSTNEFTYSLNRSGAGFKSFLNGKTSDTFTSSATILSNTRNVLIFTTDPTAVDRIRSVRTTIGGRRYYDADYPASATPFSNYAVYSDNSALCMGDLASNPIYGMGADVVGLESAADWNDSLLDDTVPRCRLAMVITDPRRTAEYLDLFADYAECFWFNEGAAIRIKPDKVIDADNPCGQLVNTNSEFLDASAWLQSGDSQWVLGGGEATIDGSQAAANTLHQSLTLADGVDYVITVVVDNTSAGTISPYIDGAISGEDYDEPGTYAVKVTGEGSSANIGVVASSDFVGAVSSIKINRLYWHETSFVKGSLSIEGLDDSDAPTSVSTRYTVPSGSSPNWQQSPTPPIRLPGVAEGEVPNVETTLHLEGITRSAEANNKANARVQRYRNRTRFKWITRNYGVRFRKGDVIQLDLETHGINERVRHEYSRMTKYGFHEVTGFRYDESHYPSELILPEGTGVVPVGAIALLSGSTVPSGWGDYTDANGKLIVGAGGSYSPGDSGGSDTFSGWSGSTPVVSMHPNGVPGGSFRASNVRRNESGSSSRTSIDYFVPDTDHSHTYDTGTITPDLLRRKNRLVIKTGTAELLIPPEIQVLGLNGLIAAGLSRVTSFAGRLLGAASSSSNAGASSVNVDLNVQQITGGHSHFNVSFGAFDADSGLALSDYYYSLDNSHDHTHEYITNLVRAVKKRGVALYGGGEAYNVIPGMVFLWSGSIGSLPSDFVLMDGSNGTDDLRDFFIEIAQIGSEGNPTGDNTISITANGTSWSHEHKGSQNGPSSTTRYNGVHSDSASHNHGIISHSSSWMPEYYALAAIMYSPS